MLPHKFIFIALCFACLYARAEEFAVAISPPRLEIKTQAGQKVREIIEISNASNRASNYTLKTADWTFGADASVTFIDELQPNSCRPWVAIERRTLTVAGGAKYRYRLEVSVPPNTPDQECRLALLIQGQDQQASTGGVSFPINAQIGIIIYVAVGKVASKLDLVQTSLGMVNGMPMPLLTISNLGNAHGRLTGFLQGVDAKGEKFELSISNTPIMPTERRQIALTPSKPGQSKASPVTYPLTVSGDIEFEVGKATKIEKVFAQ